MHNLHENNISILMSFGGLPDLNGVIRRLVVDKVYEEAWRS